MDALASISSNPTVAALLDIGLPVMDGYELARALRQLLSPACIRIIAISGYGQQSDRLAARAAGFDAHLAKPVDLAAVHHLLVAEPDAADSAD